MDIEAVREFKGEKAFFVRLHNPDYVIAEVASEQQLFRIEHWRGLPPWNPEKNLPEAHFVIGSIFKIIRWLGISNTVDFSIY